MLSKPTSESHPHLGETELIKLGFWADERDKLLQENDTECAQRYDELMRVHLASARVNLEMKCFSTKTMPYAEYRRKSIIIRFDRPLAEMLLTFGLSPNDVYNRMRALSRASSHQAVCRIRRSIDGHFWQFWMPARKKLTW